MDVPLKLFYFFLEVISNISFGLDFVLKVNDFVDFRELLNYKIMRLKQPSQVLTLSVKSDYFFLISL